MDRPEVIISRGERTSVVRQQTYRKCGIGLSSFSSLSTRTELSLVTGSVEHMTMFIMLLLSSVTICQCTGSVEHTRVYI